MKLKGLSLTECLLALIIVGTISALVVPALKSIRAQVQYKAGLKKAVYNISNAIDVNITNGDRSAYYTNSDLPLFNYLQKNIKTLNVSETSYRNSKNSQFFTNDDIRYEFPKGDEGSPEFSGIKFDNENWTVKNSNCGTKGLGIKSSNSAKKKSPCVVLVDVNGDTPPNILTPSNSVDGELSDMFLIIVTDIAAIPYGIAAQKAYYEE